MTYLRKPSGAGGRLVFEWDGLTANQFEVAASFASGGTPTLSVVADATAPKGYVLRYHVPSAGKSVWLAKTPLPSSHVLIEISDNGAPAYGGVAFFGDAVGSVHAYAWNPISIFGWRFRVDAGVQVSSGTTDNDLRGGATGAGFTRIWLRGEKPVGAPPQFAVWGHGHGSGGGRDSMLRTVDWVGEPAPASWNGLACDRWGLSMSPTAISTWDIRTLRVFDLEA
jgi:hypothetical protein